MFHLAFDIVPYEFIAIAENFNGNLLRQINCFVYR